MDVALLESGFAPKALVAGAVGSVIPGTIIAFAEDAIPEGYLNCDGSEINQETYGYLFSKISTTWNTGGEGGGNFRLPDLRGVFIRGTGNHGILNTEAGSDYVGQDVGSSENDQYQSHKHNGSYSVNSASSGELTPSRSNQSGGGYYTTTSTPVIDGSQGTWTGGETRPVNFGVKYLIKY